MQVATIQSVWILIVIGILLEMRFGYTSRFIFSRNLFEIFQNPDSDKRWSVKHRGRYLYRHPHWMSNPGPGLSLYRDMCASFDSSEEAEKFTHQWIRARYGSTKLDLKITIIKT